MKFSTNSEYKENLLSMMKELEYDYYTREEKKEIERFVQAYTVNDYEKVNFKWNGKHAEEFNDANLNFRQKILVFVCLYPNKVESLELLRDLFIEEAKCSKESWGVDEALFIIGENLLKIGKEKYIKEFCIGLNMSFDTYGCCSSMDLTGIDIQSLIDSINNEIRHTMNKNIKNSLEFGKEFIKAMSMES